MDNKRLNYKYIKLSNGENILCMTNDDCENLCKKKVIHVLEPVLVTPFRFPRGTKIVETFIMQPWVPFSQEKVFVISTNCIIMATNVVEDFKQQYESYIETAESGDKGNISEQTSQEIQEFLTEGNEGYEEEQEITIGSGRRIVH
ncbi:hypothetical protein EBR43_04180 [bacterium]|nr:hypothetical protein [bacterium]